MEKILFQHLSEACMKCDVDENDLRKGYAVYEDGSYYSVREKFSPPNLSEKGKEELSYKNELKTELEYTLVFKSTELAVKISEIFSHFSDEIKKLPRKMNNHDVLDGAVDYLRFKNKSVSGCNILTICPYKRSDDFHHKYFDEKELKNEMGLENISKIYIEIQKVINEFKDNQLFC